MSESSLPAYVRPAMIAAAVAALTSILLAIILAALVWLGAPQNSPLSALRGGFLGWLVAHGSGVEAKSFATGFVPLGATLVIAGCVAYALRGTTLNEGDSPAGFIAVFVAVYTAATTIAAIFVRTADLRVDVSKAALGALVIAMLVAMGVLRAAWWPRLPQQARAVLSGAMHSAAGVVLAGAVIVMVLLLLHRKRFAEIWTSLDAGVIGGIALALLCLALLPNFVLWSTAVMFGPGFTVGARTIVDVSGAQLGALPAVPIFAALPDPGDFPGWVFIIAAIPIAIGAYGGHKVAVVLAAASLRDRLGWAALSGLIAGAMLVALLALSGGALGPQEMGSSGPVLWPTVLIAPAILAVGGAFGAAIGHYRGTRDDPEQ